MPLCHKRFIGAILLLGAGLFALTPPPALASKESRLLAEQSFNMLASGQSDAYPKARYLCEQAMLADPADPYVRSCLGRSFHKEGALHEAYRNYMIALAIDPNQMEALAWSGEIDLERGAADKALEKKRRLENLCAGCPRSVELNNAIKRHERNSKKNP